MSSFATQAAPFDAGQVLEFSYPTDNRIKVSTRLTRRRFLVRRIRDIEAQPLEPQEIARRPDLRRSRWLLIGEDLDKHEWRQFYLGSTRRLQALHTPLFRLAYFDPLDGRIVEFFGSTWTEDQVPKARVVRDELNRWYGQRRRSRLAINIFPCTLEPSSCQIQLPSASTFAYARTANASSSPTRIHSRER